MVRVKEMALNSGSGGGNERAGLSLNLPNSSTHLMASDHKGGYINFSGASVNGTKRCSKSDQSSSMSVVFSVLHVVSFYHRLDLGPIFHPTIPQNPILSSHAVVVHNRLKRESVAAV